MEFLIGQISTFGIMFACGIILGLGFDLYRRFIGKLRRDGRAWFTNIIDILSGIIAGLVVFLVLIYANWGEFRFYVLLAIFMGTIGYFYLVKVAFKRK